MWKFISQYYLRYRAWARQTDYASLMPLYSAMGIVASFMVLLLRHMGVIAVLPWLIVGLGFIASLDALGAAIDRGAKREGIIRFFILNGLFLGVALGVSFSISSPPTAQVSLSVPAPISERSVNDNP